MPEVVVGRQPIYTRKLDVFGYELLFRGAAESDSASFQDADGATATVMLNSVLDIGMERVVGSGRAFLNCTRPFLVGELPLSLPPDKFVIEVLEDIVPDEEVMDGLRRLSAEGFLIALDDYIHATMEPFLEVADIVKLDCLALGLDGMQQHAEMLKPRKLKLLAEKVETHEEFQVCRDAGMDYFQGYFLTRPHIVKGRKTPANRMTLLRVLAAINDPDTGVDELGDIIEQDVGLAYALLRHVNSVLYGLARKVERVRDVVMVLGLGKIRSLASLMLLTQVDDKPAHLISTALVRAKMCEILADGEDGVGASAYFAAGLFSTLDALLDASLETVLDDLPLVEAVKDALLRTSESRLRSCLECVLAYERGDWDATAALGLPFAEVGAAYLAALDFASVVERQLTRRAA